MLTAASAAFVDEEIVRRIVRGETELFEALTQRYAGRIYNLALRIVRDPADAEDALQDAFLQVFTKLDSFRGESKFSTWLYKVAVNTIYGRLRKRGDVPEPAETEATPDNPEGDVIRDEAVQMLQQAIALLPLDLRVVLVARDIQELSAEETAQALHLTVAAVKTRLHRARFSLREKFQNSVNPFSAPAHHNNRRSRRIVRRRHNEN